MYVQKGTESAWQLLLKCHLFPDLAQGTQGDAQERWGAGRLRRFSQRLGGESLPRRVEGAVLLAGPLSAC